MQGRKSLYIQVSLQQVELQLWIWQDFMQGFGWKQKPFPSWVTKMVRFATDLFVGLPT